MKQARTFASSVVLDYDTLWIVGGEGMMEYLNTTELIKIDSNQEISHCNGIELPFAFYRHRMVQYNSSAIFLIGGFKFEFLNNRGFLSGETWIFDPKKNFEYRKGPPLMNTDRYLFSCAKMKIQNNATVIVVAGGQNWSNKSEIFDSVEIFFPTLGWKSGPTMPYKVYDSAMTTSLDGKGVILSGGYNSTNSSYNHTDGPLDTIIELRVNELNNELEWIIKNQTLKTPRRAHVMFLVPNKCCDDNATSNIVDPITIHNYCEIFPNNHVENASLQWTVIIGTV